MRLKNSAKGPRMIHLTDGETMVIMPGETKAVDGSRILNGLPHGLAEVRGPAEARKAPQQQPQGRLGDDDEDDEDELDPAPPELAEKATGSSDLPSLDGMDRKALEKQAKAEGVDLDGIKGTGAGGNVLVGDIKAAIEAKRGAA